MRRERAGESRVGAKHSRIKSAMSYTLAHPLLPVLNAPAIRNLNHRDVSKVVRHYSLMHILQIGHTPVLSVSEISDHFGIKDLTIKDESANYFGTHKDRKSLHVVLKAVNAASIACPEDLCILTAGNAGLSLAGIASLYGLGITAFVGGDSISPALHAQLEKACTTVIPLDLETRFWSSRELCRLAGAGQGRRISDVTNGVTAPFKGIVDEICELPPSQWPDVIVLPVGGGELFLGLARGIESRGLRTRLVGVTVRKDSAADKLYSKWNPSEPQIRSITSLSSQHALMCLDDEQLLLDTFNWLKKSTTIECEPSSAAAFAILHKLKDKLKQDERVMVINTGTFRLGQEFQFVVTS